MLKGYVSDLDQNLLYTKTPIYLLIKQPDGSRKEEAVPNADFDKRIEDKENVRFHKNTDHSLREFRGSDKLIKYAFEAIESEAYAPSRRKFIIATIEGSPNHIDTAAGFTEEDYTKMHKKIIYEILKEIERLEFIDNMRNHLRDKTIHFDKLVEIYLNHNLYIPCSNPDVIKKYRWGNKTGHEKKALGFEKCVKKTIDTYNEYYGKQFMKNRRLSVGFSDDTSKNVESVTQIVTNKLIYKYPNISFMMYNTKEATMIRKETIHHKSGSQELF